jgi:hypothetical protein
MGSVKVKSALRNRKLYANHLADYACARARAGLPNLQQLKSAFELARDESYTELEPAANYHAILNYAGPA